MGTIGATAERVVDALRAEGRRVGALRVRLFRPLPVDAIRSHYAGKKRIAVIDRNISLGLGGVLWSETAVSWTPARWCRTIVAGLGGGDVRPEHIVAMLSDLQSRKIASPPAMMEAV